MGSSPPGLSVHGISQARILEWVAISLPRDLPDICFLIYDTKNTNNKEKDI